MPVAPTPDSASTIDTRDMAQVSRALLSPADVDRLRRGWWSPPAVNEYIAAKRQAGALREVRDAPPVSDWADDGRAFRLYWRNKPED